MKALRVGREYAELSRDSKQVGLYDEVALLNDINAACAGSLASSPEATGDSAEVRLESLLRLKNADLITEDEFRAKRQAILDSI